MKYRYPNFHPDSRLRLPWRSDRRMAPMRPQPLWRMLLRARHLLRQLEGFYCWFALGHQFFKDWIFESRKPVYFYRAWVRRHFPCFGCNSCLPIAVAISRSVFSFVARESHPEKRISYTAEIKGFVHEFVSGFFMRYMTM